LDKILTVFVRLVQTFVTDVIYKKDFLTLFTIIVATIFLVLISTCTVSALCYSCHQTTLPFAAGLIVRFARLMLVFN